jgi:hypothetical protein
MATARRDARGLGGARSPQALSLSGEAGAFLTNDTTLPYEGEDFEKVAIASMMHW